MKKFREKYQSPTKHGPRDNKSEILCHPKHLPWGSWWVQPIWHKNKNHIANKQNTIALNWEIVYKWDKLRKPFFEKNFSYFYENVKLTFPIAVIKWL